MTKNIDKTFMEAYQDLVVPLITLPSRQLQLMSL